MAALNMNFNAAEVEPTNVFDPLPNGEYMVVVTHSDMKQTNNGTGQYLELELEVIDGNFKGRKVWDRLNLINQNQKAVEIAQRQLSALCHATGVMQVTDSAQLHNIPVVATVKYREANGQYSASNDVRGYKRTASQQPVQQPVQQQVNTQSQQPAQQVDQQPVTTGARPPWGK